MKARILINDHINNWVMLANEALSLQSQQFVNEGHR